MTKQENPNFKASRFAPNPQEVAYWIDLTADPNGGVIKTYDGTEWYPINQSEVNIPVVSEDANGLMSSDMLVKLKRAISRYCVLILIGNIIERYTFYYV